MLGVEGFVLTEFVVVDSSKYPKIKKNRITKIQDIPNVPGRSTFFHKMKTTNMEFWYIT